MGIKLVHLTWKLVHALSIIFIHRADKFVNESFLYYYCHYCTLISFFGKSLVAYDDTTVTIAL